MDRDLYQKQFGIVGESVEIKELVDVILQVAPTDITVLITGESGTGKELIAKALHFNSRRGAAPFVPINCSALPEHLLESELFGHRKGAFTGAVDEHKGLFEICNRHGALFLDEIGELSVPVQIKLLQVLQERTFCPVGSHEPKRFAGRV